jgi:hypothetical protein
MLQGHQLQDPKSNFKLLPEQIKYTSCFQKGEKQLPFNLGIGKAAFNKEMRPQSQAKRFRN